MESISGPMSSSHLIPGRSFGRVGPSRTKSSASGQPAAFLDRDGTIIKQVELLHNSKQMRLLPGAAEAIRMLNRNGVKVIVVTNQPVVARGISTLSDVEGMHELLNRRLQRNHAHVDAFYFCPHHTNATIEEFRFACNCRKPSPGMILLATAEHGLNLRQSVMIGDTTQDMLTGRRAGVRTILVKTGHGGKDPWQYECSADHEAPDLRAAVSLWLKETR